MCANHRSERHIVLEGEGPFEGLTVYKNDYGRKNKGYVEIYRNNKMVYNIPYPRYLGCIKAGRILNKFEKVWLIDNNKPVTMDNIEIKLFEVFNGIGPFEGCIISKPNNGKKIQEMSVRIFKDNILLYRMHYTKYLGCIKENRILEDDEYIEIIDKNKTIDINNIEVIKQKAFQGEGPFSECMIYKFISKENNRCTVSIRYNANKRIMMNYSRYLMCLKENRILTRDEEVDHIDGDKTNDNIDNLRILSPYENKLKAIHNNETPTSVRKFIVLKCPYCGKIFQRKLSYYTFHLKSKKHIMYCSKSCVVSIKNFKPEKRKEVLKEFLENGYTVIKQFELPALLHDYASYMFTNYYCESTPYSKIDEYGFAISDDIGATPYDVK